MYSLARSTVGMKQPIKVKKAHCHNENVWLTKLYIFGGTTVRSQATFDEGPRTKCPVTTLPINLSPDTSH